MFPLYTNDVAPVLQINLVMFCDEVYIGLIRFALWCDVEMCADVGLAVFYCQ